LDEVVASPKSKFHADGSITLATLLASHGSWPKQTPVAPKGILTGADQTQEWLLPWWWEHYHQHNDYPVIFADFGLSTHMKNWCKERGKCIAIPAIDVFIQDKEDVDPVQANAWESYYGDRFWSYRKSWFKKPLACLQTDYDLTLWIDLDCEIRGSLSPILQSCCSVSLCRERPQLYNSGVIAFRYGTSLIEEWARSTFHHNHQHRGDQDLLSWLIAHRSFVVEELPAIYNWLITNGDNPHAIINHWVGESAKNVLAHQIQLRNFL
jgi:hypothetical protein